MRSRRRPIGSPQAPPQLSIASYAKADPKAVHEMALAVAGLARAKLAQFLTQEMGACSSGAVNHYTTSNWDRSRALSKDNFHPQHLPRSPQLIETPPSVNVVQGGVLWTYIL